MKSAMVCDRLEKGISGICKVEVIRDGPNGPEVIATAYGRNVITAEGKTELWRLAQGNQTDLFDQFRVGTCGATPTSNNTDVISPVTTAGNQTRLQTADSMTVDTGRTYQWIISFASGAGTLTATSLEEFSIMNQRTQGAGDSLCRAVFTPAVNKTTADKLKLTYKARIT